MLKKTATLKRFEYSPLGKAIEKHTYVVNKQTEVINKRQDKRNKLLKTITGTDEKYHDKVENALIYLLKKLAEKYVEIDKRMKSEDLPYGKHNFNNRYGMVVSFVSNFLTEVTD